MNFKIWFLHTWAKLCEFQYFKNQRICQFKNILLHTSGKPEVKIEKLSIDFCKTIKFRVSLFLNWHGKNQLLLLV